MCFFWLKVRKWIIDWNLTTEKKHTLLRLVYEALVDCKKRYPGFAPLIPEKDEVEISYECFPWIPCCVLPYSEAAAKVMVELLGSYTEDNASQARVDAHR